MFAVAAVLNLTSVEVCVLSWTSSSQEELTSTNWNKVISGLRGGRTEALERAWVRAPRTEVDDGPFERVAVAGVGKQYMLLCDNFVGIIYPLTQSENMMRGALPPLKWPFPRNGLPFS